MASPWRPTRYAGLAQRGFRGGRARRRGPARRPHHHPARGRTGCVHGVAWYARTLGTAFLAAITADPPVPLADALAGAIGEVRPYYESTCDLANPVHSGGHGDRRPGGPGRL